MTIASRNWIHAALAAVACLSAAAWIWAAIAVAASLPPDRFGQWSGFLGEAEAFGLALPSVPVAMGTSGLLAIGSAVALVAIARGFRKTVSVEIFFFAFWLAACSLESLRAFCYASAVAGYPASWGEGLTRALAFARAFGCMSLFASSLHAAGFRNEKPGAEIAVIALVALGAATGLPLDSGRWTETLHAGFGWEPLLATMIAAFIVGTTADFAVAGVTRNESAYRQAALAAAAASTGFAFASNTVNPLVLLVSLVALGWGSARFLIRMHSYYLWQ